MGCGCNFINKYHKEKEFLDQNFINYEEMMESIKNDPSKLKSLIKIQRFYRKKYFPHKNNVISKENSMILTPTQDPITNSDSKITLTIPEEELTTLLKELPPLSDGISVQINGPIKDDNYNSVYLGEWDFSKNVKHGRGIQVYSEGSKYFGYWVQDKANIKGKLIHSDGDVYEGEWLDNQPNGKGKYFHQDGTIYEGDWKNDKQHGKGKEKWPDGSWYEGDYIQGMKQGKGIFHWADNSEYKGEFKNNNINGIGTYTFGDGREYTGSWVNNKLDGKGVFTWPDKRKYEGEYKNDKKEGFGTFYWNDGKIYKGYWKNGKQDGKGEFYNPKEKIWNKGIWKAGIKVKWEN